MAKIFSVEPISEAQIADWKEKHRGVFDIDVPATDEDDDLLIEANAEMKLAKALPESTDDEKALKEQAIADAQAKLDSVKILKGYFRKVGIDELGMVDGQKNKLKGSLILYNTSLLGGHPAFENDEDVKIAALKQMGVVLKQRSAVIKKL